MRIVLLKVLIFMVAITGVYAQDELALLDFSRKLGRQVPKKLLNKTSIYMDNVSFEEAIENIEESSDIQLNYNHDLMPLNKKVSLSMKDVYTAEVLLAFLSKTGTALSISDGGHLLVVPQNNRQNKGTITGIVKDSSTGNPLPSANLVIEGTSLGTTSDIDGQYKLKHLLPGTYTVRARYIGFKDQTREVQVKYGKAVKVDFKLEYAAVEGEEVVISAQAEGQMAAINQQISARTIKNVVAADRIQEIPDANAAESVSRLPGISIVRSGGEGQKVTIRGLSPKYNVMMVNGVRMQSTDRNDRSVDLNMITPNILSGIEVTKALTAAMDADAVGGTVNLKIGKADEGFHSKFSVQDGYGSLADTYGNSRLTGLLSNRFINNKLGVQVSGYWDDFNRNSDVLSAGYALNEEAVLENGLIPIDLASATISDKVTDRQRAGGSLIIDYQFSNGSLLLNNFISNLSEDQVEMQNSFVLSGNQFTAFAADRELSNTVISNALQGEFNFFNINMDFSFSNSISKQYSPGDLSMNINPESWQAGFSTPTLEDPLKATPSTLLNSAEVIDALRISRIYTLERDVVESAQDAVINFNVPFNFSKYISGELKFGGKYVHNNRDNDETLRYNQTEFTQFGEEFVRAMRESLWTDLGLGVVDEHGGMRASLFEDPDYDIGNFLSGKEGVDQFFYTPSIDKMKHFEELASENDAYPLYPMGSFQYDYDYTRDLSAFYVMTDLNIGNYVTLLPGVRYEKYDINYNAFYTQKFGPNPEDFLNEPLESNTNSENWFPQMQIRIKPNSWLDVRLASTKSIIYPDYRAVSPYIYYDTSGIPVMTLGNPSLKSGLSQNYDIYTSVYDNYVGLFTAGYFYKEIDDLIVSSSFKTKDSEKINNRYELPQTAQTKISTWINLGETSTVKGFELDWQTHFWYLPSFLKGTVFNINYTHITSETSYPFQVFVKQGTGPFAKSVGVDSTRSGRMPNQPNDILNATVGYDISGFSARLSFLYQDNVLGGAHSTYTELDSYTDAYYRWDLTVYQKLPWHKGLQVFMNINNITNRSDRQFVSVLELLSSADYYGRTLDVGLRYQF